MATEVDVDGRSAAWAPPKDGGPAPGVIVLHELFGLNGDIRRIVDRFGEAGYATVAPDLYDDGPKTICLVRTVLDSVRGGHATTAKVDAVRQWLVDRPEVAGRPVGIVGFCLGGGFALTAAVRTDVAAVSVNYGTVPDDLAGVCPVVASYGGKDPMFRSTGATLAARLAELGVPHDVEVYPGVGHSFMSYYGGLVGRVARTYDEDAAEDSWRRILAFFATHLQQ